MKKPILVVAWILMTWLAFADELIIPFSCYPKEVVKKFAEYGKKLDVDPNDRDEKSWGFIKNEGSSFKIYTYLQIKPEELALIQKLVMEKQNGKN